MLGCLSPIAASKPNVAVYRGDGAGWRSVHSTVKSLQQLLPPAFKVCLLFEAHHALLLPAVCSVAFLHCTVHQMSPDSLLPRLWCGSPGRSIQQVDTIDAQDLLGGGWQGTTALLVMPGGADLPYCRRLNGRGNKLISGGDCGVAGTHAGRAPISQTCWFRGPRGNHSYQAVTSQSSFMLLACYAVCTCSLYLQITSGWQMFIREICSMFMACDARCRVCISWRRLPGSVRRGILRLQPGGV